MRDYDLDWLETYRDATTMTTTYTARGTHKVTGDEVVLTMNVADQVVQMGLSSAYLEERLLGYVVKHLELEKGWQ